MSARHLRDYGYGNRYSCTFPSTGWRNPPTVWPAWRPTWWSATHKAYATATKLAAKLQEINVWLQFPVVARLIRSPAGQLGTTGVPHPLVIFVVASCTIHGARMSLRGLALGCAVHRSSSVDPKWFKILLSSALVH